MLLTFFLLPIRPLEEFIAVWVPEHDPGQAARERIDTAH